MTDPLNQKISQFLDDDLGASESLKLLRALENQPELKRTMQRYALINQALKTRPALMADASFSEQLQAKLAKEPVYLLPKRRLRPPIYQKAALALAASLTAVAILVPTLNKNVDIPQLLAAFTPDLYSSEPAAKNPQTALNTLHAEASSFLGAPNFARQYPVTNRFRNHLQAHNDSLYTNGAANFQYNAQLTHYGQGE